MWSLVSRPRLVALSALLATGLLAMAVMISPVFAEDDPKPTTITIAPIDQPKGEPAILSATLKDADGNVLGGQMLRFYVLTEVFGPRLMKVGEALTDVSGTASVAFRPSWLGENKVTVIYAGSQASAKSQAEAAFNAVGPVKLHQNAEFGLQTVRDWAPFVAFSLVFVVWATLLVVLFRTFRVMRPRRSKAAVPATQAAGVQPLPDER